MLIPALGQLTTPTPTEQAPRGPSGINPPPPTDLTNVTRGDFDTNTPHDALFKRTFASPERAAALLRAKLPEDLASQIDWTTLRPVPGSFVNPRLASLYTDLLFSVRLGDAELLLYLLLEHRSQGARDMPFRLLEYVIEIWRRQREQAIRQKRDPNSLPPSSPSSAPPTAARRCSRSSTTSTRSSKRSNSRNFVQP